MRWKTNGIQALKPWAITTTAASGMTCVHLQNALLWAMRTAVTTECQIADEQQQRQEHRSAAQCIKAGSQEAPHAALLGRGVRPQQSLKRLEADGLGAKKACHQPSNSSCNYMSCLVHWQLWQWWHLSRFQSHRQRVHSGVQQAIHWVAASLICAILQLPRAGQTLGNHVLQIQLQLHQCCEIGHCTNVEVVCWTANGNGLEEGAGVMRAAGTPRQAPGLPAPTAHSVAESTGLCRDAVAHLDPLTCFLERAQRVCALKTGRDTAYLTAPAEIICTQPLALAETCEDRMLQAARIQVRCAGNHIDGNRNKGRRQSSHSSLPNKAGGLHSVLCKVCPMIPAKSRQQAPAVGGAPQDCQSRRQLQGEAASMAQPDACTCKCLQPFCQTCYDPCFAPSAVPL